MRSIEYSPLVLYEQDSDAKAKESEVRFKPGSPGFHSMDASWAPAHTTIAMARSQHEARQVLQLRYEVYTHEMGARLAGADADRREIRDALDPYSYLWYARENGAVVGTIAQTMIGPHFNVSLLPEELALDTFPRSANNPIGFSSRFTIAPDHRGSWVLPSLARYTYAHGRELGAKFDLMLTRPALVPLFERVGYVRYTTSAYRLRDFDLLIPMVLPATDYEHLRNVRSACLPCAMQFPHEPEWGAWLRATHPWIDTYYGIDARQAQYGAALARRTSIPARIAEVLGATSFVHHFPEGTLLRAPGDRVTCSYLALSGKLSVKRIDDDGTQQTRCATDGVAFAQDVIRCESGADVLCIPDSAFARVARQFPEQAAVLQQLLGEASIETYPNELLR